MSIIVCLIFHHSRLWHFIFPPLSSPKHLSVPSSFPLPPLAAIGEWHLFVPPASPRRLAFHLSLLPSSTSLCHQSFPSCHSLSLMNDASPCRRASLCHRLLLRSYLWLFIFPPTWAPLPTTTHYYRVPPGPSPCHRASPTGTPADVFPPPPVTSPCHCLLPVAAPCCRLPSPFLIVELPPRHLSLSSSSPRCHLPSPLSIVFHLATLPGF